jgi:hypothetical protein
MGFQNVITATTKYFPRVTVKYKDNSWLMLLLAKVLFFKKDFLNYCTVVGHIIYLPRQRFVRVHPVSSTVLFLYELVHLHHSKKNACLSALYVIWRLSQKKHFVSHLDIETKNFIHQLQNPWLSSTTLEQQFQVASQKIQNGERPFSDPIFDTLDDLISKF